MQFQNQKNLIFVITVFTSVLCSLLVVQSRIAKPFLQVPRNILLINGQSLEKVFTMFSDVKIKCEIMCVEAVKRGNRPLRSVNKYSSNSGKCECVYVPEDENFLDVRKSLAVDKHEFYSVSCKFNCSIKHVVSIYQFPPVGISHINSFF